VQNHNPNERNYKKGDSTFTDIPSAVSSMVSWLLPDSTAFHNLSVLSQLTEARVVLAGLGLKATLTTGPS